MYDENEGGEGSIKLGLLSVTPAVAGNNRLNGWGSFCFLCLLMYPVNNNSQTQVGNAGGQISTSIIQMPLDPSNQTYLVRNQYQGIKSVEPSSVHVTLTVSGLLLLVRKR